MLTPARLFSLLLVFALFAALPVPSSALADGGKADRCNVKRALAASISAINEDIDRWRGKCVVVEATLFRHRLYPDRKDILTSPLIGSDNPKTLPLNIDKVELPIQRPRKVRVTGTVGSCQDTYDFIAAEREKDPRAIIMASGFCHYTTENFIKPTSFENIGEPIFRLTEAEIPLDHRPLQPVAADALGTQDLDYRDTAIKVLRALATADRTAFLEIAVPEIEELRQARQAGEPLLGLEDDIAQANDVFDTARATHPDLPKLAARANGFRLFALGEQDVEGGGYVTLSGRDAGGYLFCWCRGDDCAGKWPIVPWDADNDPARPYFCLDVVDYVIFRRGAVPSVDLQISRNGFVEPPL